MLYQLFGSSMARPGRGLMFFERGGGSALAALVTIAGLTVHLLWFNVQVRSTVPLVDRELRSNH
jgi:hypothetical protein